MLDLYAIYRDPEALKQVIEDLSEQAQAFQPNVVCGIAAQGLILATGIALKMSLPLIVVRKWQANIGFPCWTCEVEDQGLRKKFALVKYDVPQGARVLIVDDNLKSGVQARVAWTLLKQAGAAFAAFACVHSWDCDAAREMEDRLLVADGAPRTNYWPSVIEDTQADAVSPKMNP